MSVRVEIVRVDDTGRISTFLPAPPAVGDLLDLQIRHRNLVGRFLVLGRVISPEQITVMVEAA